MATAYENAAKYFDKELVEPIRQQLVGRKLFGKVTRVDPGVFNIDYNTLTDMGDAIVTFDLPDDTIEKDSVKVATSSMKIGVISKGYKIPRSQFDAFARQGTPLDTAAMISAAQKVGEKEDDMLLQGWAPDGSNYKIKGLYQTAGNSYTTQKDFATFGYPTAAISGALALLYEDGIVGTNFNLVLNYAQYAELQANYEYGTYEWDKIMKMINPNPGAGQGQILMSTDITAGTGMMTPVDTAGVYMDLIVGADYKNQVAVPKFDISPVEGITYTMVVPRIKHTNAICTLTKI